MNKMRVFTSMVLLSFAFGVCQRAAAQEARTPEQAPQAEQSTSTDQASQPEIYRPEGKVIVPESSVQRPEDAGKRAHTNHLIFVPKGRPVSSPVPDNTFAETPASLGCVYKIGPIYTGCNPGTGGTKHPTGGWGAIALVDAFDNPNAASDLAVFAAHFGYPAPNFTKVYANTSFGTLNGLNASCSGAPSGDVGWGLEEDLDVQWAFAMAPSSHIYLIEACTNSYNDLLFAEQVAGIEVDAAGGGDISNSWGSGEFSGEVSFDNYFFRYHWKRITYFASSGDIGSQSYPSSSPWVVSAGGTTVNRDASGNFVSESAWSGSGGGFSPYEIWQSPPDISNGMGPWSDYQYRLYGGYPYATAPRSTPDIAFDADPASGVYVYDTYGYGGYVIVGGTSVSSPSLAGIINNTVNGLGQAPSGGGYYHTAENDLLYSQLEEATGYPQNFYDVKTGSCGSPTRSAVKGYDQCTGVGTPQGRRGK